MLKKYIERKEINYSQVGQEILEYWKKNKIFQKSISSRDKNPTFTFYEGPPSANGIPGIHHVMARTIKDIFCRYKTLKGYQVKRKGGWDTHGLPIELQVEKELGITKEDIGVKISVADYNKKCKESVMKYKGKWDELTQMMGYWVDLDNPYITFENSYIESVWYLLKELYKKGLLYKGLSVQPYSPAAGSGLSSHELNQPGTYKLVKDTSIVAQFKLKKDDNANFLFDNENEDVRILAWTTTPWTLPSNCALAVGKKIDYVKVKTFNPYTFKAVSVILAKELVNRYFSDKNKDIQLSDYKEGDKNIPFLVSKSFKGEDLCFLRYEQLMPYVTNENLEKNAFKIIPGDFVTTEEGTGIVHTASLYGADDFRICQQYNIPPIMGKDDNGEDVPLVDRQGRFTKEVTDFAGLYLKEEYYSLEERENPNFKPTDVLISIKLKNENKAFKVEKYEHTYPHCWRTDKPILYYPLDAWFIKTTALKDRLVALNKTINWKPESTGTGRFGNWLENLVDWNLSRSRFWGTPLPIWVTKDRQDLKCIGSLAELNEEINLSIKAGFMKSTLPNDFDLHRPYVDDIVLVNSKGEPMYREPDLIDVWFDSGAMPYAQWHYPFENKDIFDASYPADFIAEGIDQTRGWFFTLHAISTLVFDKVSFKNVISNGLVLDKNGEKMSKTRGNTVDPFEILNKYGPDVTRWYMIVNANPWDNLKFDIDGIDEVLRKFFGTLFNTYSFFVLYANLDGFVYQGEEVPLEKRMESDRWILSKLNRLIIDVDSYYEDYEPTKVARAVQEFVTNELSNWYVRLNRKRFWIGQLTPDKNIAYQTLYQCLVTVAKLISPIAPFYADRLYQDLNNTTQKEKEESVHLCSFPKANTDFINDDLEEKMYLAQLTSSLTHSLRKKEKLKARQPLSKIMIPVLDKKMKQQLQNVEQLILTETNVKKIEYIEDDSKFLIKKATPNFKTLGIKFGEKIKKLTPIIKDLNQHQINEFEKNKKLILMVDGENIELDEESITTTFEDIPGWSVAKEGFLTVALDITLTQELKEEGLARDVVNRIQNMRKNLKFDVVDKINILYYSKDALMNIAIQNFETYIKTETQALSLQILEKNKGEFFDIDGINLEVKINKVSN